jgi:hypothetical protein
MGIRSGLCGCYRLKLFFEVFLPVGRATCTLRTDADPRKLRSECEEGGLRILFWFLGMVARSLSILFDKVFCWSMRLEDMLCIVV